MLSVQLPKVVRTASFRLAALYAGLFALSAILLGTIFFWAVESALERHRAQRIEAEIAFFESKFRSEGLAELIEEIAERIRSGQGGGLYYAVVGADQRLLAGNLNMALKQPGWIEVNYPTNVVDGGERLRVFVADLGNSIRLAVGDDFGLIEEINGAVFSDAGWVLAAFIVLGLVGGWLLSVAFLKRVDAITKTADAIIEGDLARRIPLRGDGDDFDRLSATLNRMLDRISGLLENLRQVTNDIAHDLRTPLTRLRNQLFAASGTRNETELHAAIEDAIGETDEILATFAAVLRIAQVEAGTRKAGFQELDLSQAFERAADDFRPAAEEEGKTLVAEIHPGLTARGDKELVTHMLANLIDNAIQHTATGTRITVSLVNSPAGVAGSVADNGVGVPEDEREKIFRRFYRLERSRTTKGSGLGLAFVAAVADLHQIDLKVQDNSPGLRVVMRFPQASKGALPT